MLQTPEESFRPLQSLRMEKLVEGKSSTQTVYMAHLRQERSSDVFAKRPSTRENRIKEIVSASAEQRKPKL